MLEEPEPTEVTFACGRLPGRTYVSRTFVLDLRASADFGQAARYVTKVFDEEPSSLDTSDPSLEWTEEVVMTSPGGRKQIKLQVAREAGLVRQIQLERVPTDPAATRMDVLLTLNREQSQKLLELVRSLDYVPANDSETVRLDDELLKQVFRDPSAIDNLYMKDPERVRELIQSDASAEDVVALAHRQAVVREFRRLLSDAKHFAALEEEAGGAERVWQRFLERNPWILGLGLDGQLLTGWDEERLEQTVSGFTTSTAGKRVDALLKTNGKIRSLVFAEIKHHLTALVGTTSYRAGCWAPSTEVSGGVTQVHQTVDQAVRQLGERLIRRGEDGFETNDTAFLVRPKSFLIVGDLGQFKGPDGGVHVDKYRSFELFRRHLSEPELVTFDELLARAEWVLSLAEARRNERAGGDHFAR